MLPGGGSSGEVPAAPPPQGGVIHTGVGCLVIGCGVSLVFCLLTFVVWLVRGRL